MTELRTVIICLKFVYFIFHWGGEQVTKSFILSFLPLPSPPFLRIKLTANISYSASFFSDLMSVVLLKNAGNYIYFSYLLLN